jgi:hypothetical protein
LWPAQHTIDIEAVAEEGIGNNDDEEEEQPLDAKLSAAQRQGYWLVEALTRESRSLCREFGLPMELGTNLLRHIVTGFTKKHLL